MKQLFTLLVAVSVAAVPLAAQQHPHGAPGEDSHGKKHGRSMMDGMSMMHGKLMEFAPQHLLDYREQLGLSSQQVTRLEGLRDAAKPAHDRAAKSAHAAADSLQKALAAATPDTVLARRLFRAHHDAMGEAHWVMLNTAAQAKAVLTDAQRARMDGWEDAMHREHH